MNGLISALKSLARDHPLEEFKWDIPDNCPLKIPTDSCDIYSRNIYLKDNLYTILKNDSNLDSHYWSIQKWGGIGSFKRNDKNDKRIRSFLGELQKGRLTRRSFECISSLSKVASFLNSSEYAIYDSRAIYALNWLIFNYEKSCDLFPQPTGRNAELVRYDMQTIFRLTKKEFAYKSYDIAFHDYCKLLKQLSDAVYGHGSKPYKIEMLLFIIAPGRIINEIESTVSLSIAINALSTSGS